MLPLRIGVQFGFFFPATRRGSGVYLMNIRYLFEWFSGRLCPVSDWFLLFDSVSSEGLSGVSC